MSSWQLNLPAGFIIFNRPDTTDCINSASLRITEVETLPGSADKTSQNLGWVPEISEQDIYREMAAHNLVQAKQHVLPKANEWVRRERSRGVIQTRCNSRQEGISH